MNSLSDSTDPSTQLRALQQVQQLVSGDTRQRPDNQRQNSRASTSTLDSLVSLVMCGSTTDVQKQAAAALMRITSTRSKDAQDYVGAKPCFIRCLADLLSSCDSDLQRLAASNLAALADMHPANQERISGTATRKLVVLLSSISAGVQEAAAIALLSMCTPFPELADWVEECPGAREGLTRLLLQDRDSCRSARAAAAVTLVLVAPGRSSITQLLEQHASVVWEALPVDLVPRLGLHTPHVWVLVQALHSLATGSPTLQQAMQRSRLLPQVLQALHIDSNNTTRDALRRLTDLLWKDPLPMPHPSESVAAAKPDGARAEQAAAPDPWCPCCQDQPKQLVFRCGHAVCKACRDRLRTPSCPICRTDISTFQMQLFL